MIRLADERFQYQGQELRFCTEWGPLEACEEERHMMDVEFSLLPTGLRSSSTRVTQNEFIPFSMIALPRVENCYYFPPFGGRMRRTD